MTQNAVVETVQKSWQDLLGVERASGDQNFFDLGGDSLIAIEFVTRIEDELDVEFPLEALFMDVTLAGVIDAITLLMTSTDA